MAGSKKVSFLGLLSYWALREEGLDDVGEQRNLEAEKMSVAHIGFLTASVHANWLSGRYLDPQ